MDVALFKDNKFSFSLPSLSIFGRKKANWNDILKILASAVCYNQGKYIEFEFLVSEKHKSLKTATYQATPDLNEVAKCYDELLAHMEMQLQTVSKKNFQFLRDYFCAGKRSRYAPRICIKVVKSGKIAEGYRSEKRTYFLSEHSPGENTGFESVVENGTYYLENNIPESAIKGYYKNPRLDPLRVHNYKASRKSRFVQESIDQDWVDCWFREPSDPPPIKWQCACYKSTLIIPMTLINNDLDSEFRDTFFGPVPEESRAIWGFLCFDHPTTEYFNEEDDVKIGYIFADVLSLYFISAHIHNSRSKTFGLACQLLKKVSEG